MNHEGARPPARIKSAPEDFLVDEIPLYEPGGTGDHLYVRFRKRGLNTDDAVRALASALGANARDAGVAGMKDKVAVTTQTVSFAVPRGQGALPPEGLVERARALALVGIDVLDARLHGNKLRTGHLAGNRFAIALRGVGPGDVAGVVARLEQAGREGVPNAYGAQRFGVRGDNADRALAWLTGAAPAPRDPRLRRLHWSALQSALFNEVLARRVADGTWAIPLEGDLLKKEDSGGLFSCSDVMTDRARAAAGEVSPTGPIAGVKMKAPTGAPGALEQAVVAERLGAAFDWDRTRALGEGTRRSLRLWVRELSVTVEAINAERQEDRTIWVRFVLPSGAYATTVLGTAVALMNEPSQPASTPPISEPIDD